MKMSPTTEMQQVAPDNGPENTIRIDNLFHERYPNLPKLSNCLDDDEDYLACAIFDCIQGLWHPGITFAQWYEATVTLLITGGSNGFSKTHPHAVADRVKELDPDGTAIEKLTSPPVRITSPIIPIIDVQCGVEGAVVIAGLVERIAPRDENDLQRVKKRGYELRGPTMCLHMFLRDDSDSILYKIDRFDYERLALEVIKRGRAGKALYAIKGTVPLGFRMIKVQRVLYLTDMQK
jgi:hypothetical protein